MRIAPGQTWASVPLTILSGSGPEPTERFFVNAWNPDPGQDLFTGFGVVTIDPPAARVFVSHLGSDGNECRSAATPCRTLDGGIRQVDLGGEVIVVSSGSYWGADITKPVTVDAPPGVVAFSASPITINAAPSDTVIVRGLTLKALTNGSGSGLAFQGGGALFVERAVIDGWDRGIDFASAGQL